MHSAVVTTSKGGPLEILQVPTVEPIEGEVQVRVEWTASTPLDLHQNDGALLVTHPQVLGDGTAGTVVKTGPGVKKFKIGDKVSLIYAVQSGASMLRVSGLWIHLARTKREVTSGILCRS